MLTDIFANRYSGIVLRDTFTEADRRLFLQCFRILSEQICPYFVNGKETDRGKAFWSSLNSRLSMELGRSSLSHTHYKHAPKWDGKQFHDYSPWTMDRVCGNWMLTPYDGSESADQFVKERLSLVELGFRTRENEIAAANAKLPEKLENAKLFPMFNKPSTRFRPAVDLAVDIQATNDFINAQFQAHVDELNTRFRQAGYDLNYHNGFIQRTKDDLTERQVEKPFWSAVADPKWKNVDTDIKEALDRRDTNQRDPAFYAARALESAIKIIADEKGWTSGKEKGAHNFIDVLAAKKNGFLSDWEATTLKTFFTSVRNPLGHGPGLGEMPSLTAEQTDWAIETCMSWIRSLIQRM